jgi:hypothetical protein
MYNFKNQPGRAPVTQASPPMTPLDDWEEVDNQDVEDGVRPGSVVKPIPEVYEGHNFPYRGTETHGVSPLYTNEVPPEQQEGGMVPVQFHADQENKPVYDVRIVQESDKEFETWRTDQITVADANPVQIANRNKRRTSLTIKNLDAALTLYVAPNIMSAKATLAWPIGPGGTFALAVSDRVFAFSPTGAPIAVAIWAEYTTG